jgi:hypothetical protein
MVILRALRQVRMNTVVLAASPLDADNQQNMKEVAYLLKKKVGVIHNLYSNLDLVTKVVGGARSWNVSIANQNFSNWNRTEVVREFTNRNTLSVAAHTAFTAPKFTSMLDDYAQLLRWQ